LCFAHSGQQWNFCQREFFEKTKKAEMLDLEARTVFPPDLQLQINSLEFQLRTRGGQKKLLEDVNAIFKSSELSMIAGQSGSGKSTLLQLLASPKPLKSITLNGSALGKRGLQGNTCLIP